MTALKQVSQPSQEDELHYVLEDMAAVEINDTAGHALISVGESHCDDEEGLADEIAEIVKSGIAPKFAALFIKQGKDADLPGFDRLSA